MELLRQESVEFRNQSEAAILNLRWCELTLDQYLLEARGYGGGHVPSAHVGNGDAVGP